VLSVVWADDRSNPNSAGKAGAVVDPRSETPVVTRARLRAASVIAAQVAGLREVAARPTGEFERGALAALSWLLDGGPGPMTGEVGRCPGLARVIVQELAAAEAVIYGPGTDRTHYARGVEHALMWAQFVTCCPPLG
jgi:hypothetical protein